MSQGLVSNFEKKVPCGMIKTLEVNVKFAGSVKQVASTDEMLSLVLCWRFRWIACDIERYSSSTACFMWDKSTELTQPLLDATEVTAVLSPSVTAIEFSHFIQCLDFDNISVTPFE